MQRYKIVFGGRIGAGKSKAIQSISEIPVFATEALNTDEAAHSKLLTTVGIDYGEFTIDDQTKIGLYGTPGQQRFSFIWPLIAQGALGVIILVDHSGPDPLGDLELYLNAFSGEDRTIVIGVTHMDVGNTCSLKQYRDWQTKNNKQHPVFAVDARKRSDVLLLIEAIIASLEVQLLS